MQQIIGLLNNYGDIVLPTFLILELIALPLPGEAIAWLTVVFLLAKVK